MVKAIGFGRKEVKQMLYIVLAALLCFVGPTYFVAAINRVVPQIYSMVMGFLLFLIGIFIILRLVKE